jgi:hypothetical protein
MILGRSGLTARRRQCLDALAAAVAAGGGPVHYSAVAVPLGISAWTAYDLLRELERDHLVAASYAHRPGVAVGRTQVAFAPTEAGRAALGTAGAVLPEDRALRRARARVAALVAHAGLGAAFPRGGSSRAGLPGLDGRGQSQRGSDLAGQLGFWLHCAEQLPRRTRSGLHQLLGSAPEAATALTMFVSAVYGGLAQRGGEEVEELAAAVAEFQLRLARTTAARRERLARSLAAAVDTRSFLGES